jgi:hypothetical protein
VEARRSAEEWFTAFELNPEVRHIFVEGPRDADILSELIGEQANLDVRTISEVNIRSRTEPTPYLGGARLRLYEFGRRIDENGAQNVRVLLDADMGPFDPTAHFPACSVRTDYCNLVVCFISWEDLRAALVRATGYSLQNDDQDLIVEAMRFLFAFRKYRYEAHPNLTPPQSTVLIKCAQRVALIDRPNFLARFVLMGCPSSPAEIQAAIDQTVAELRGLDPRYYWHFHDFVETLFTYLRCLQRLPPGFRADHLQAIILAGLRLNGPPPAVDSVVIWARGEAP